MNDSSHATGGLMMIMSPTRKPAVVIAARYIGNPDDAKDGYNHYMICNHLLLMEDLCQYKILATVRRLSAQKAISSALGLLVYAALTWLDF